MQPITYDLRLDAERNGSQASIVVKQNDRRARLLRLRLFSEATPLAMVPGMVAVLRAVKPDETILFNDCEIDGNTLKNEITQQMMAAPGRVVCEVAVYGADSSVITTPRFDVYVESLVYDDGAIESTDEYTGLTEAMTRLAALEVGVTAAEEDREEAEQERKENEAEREALYEEIRETYESGGFDGADAAIEIVETITGPEGTEASFQDAPGSTPQDRRYIATIPRGDTGNVYNAAFYIDLESRQLMMVHADAYGGPGFRLNYDTRNLEVVYHG